LPMRTMGVKSLIGSKAGSFFVAGSTACEDMTAIRMV
jgi:hypothetical protein